MNLEGSWKNQFGSVMTLRVRDGRVDGLYSSHTGATGLYRLTGLTDVEPVGDSQTVAFAVSWRSIDGGEPDPSWHWVSGFAGQLQVIDGQEVITTTWLLVENTTPDDNWQSTIVDKATFVRIQPQMPAVAEMAAAAHVRFDLVAGRAAANGATQWYATVGLGTPAQDLRYMVDTGTTHTWITSTACDTEACEVHRRFDADASSTYRQVGRKPTTIDFGPWGEMAAILGQDVLTLERVSGDAGARAVLEEPLRLFLATRYTGRQFEQLACDGGLSVPSRLPDGVDSGELLPMLLRQGLIELPLASFWYDADAGRGQGLLGAVEPERFEPDSLVLAPLRPDPAFDYLWTVLLDRFDCAGEPVLEDISFALDTGSSWFKGDARYIQALRDAVTDGGRLPATLHGADPDFSPYPPISLVIQGTTWGLEPEQYFLQVEDELWMLGFHHLEGLDDLLLVGTLFLETVYSVFYYGDGRHENQGVALARRRHGS